MKYVDEYRQQTLAEGLARLERETRVSMLRRHATVVDWNVREPLSKALRQADLEVPSDLSLICFGDPPWYSLWTPGITTIGLPTLEMAEACASELMRQISGGPALGQGPAAHLSIEPMFLVRETTAPPKPRASLKRPRRGAKAAGSRALST